MKNLKYFIVLLIFLTGCSSSSKNIDETTKSTHISHNHISGDLQEITSHISILPQFLNSKTETIRLVYEASSKATDLLEWIPCYCGCGESANHKNNLQCFIAEIREDESVVWDDHGTRCNVCLDIAVESIRLYQEGKPIKEIRQLIDEKYKEGYLNPTPTEMPA